MRDAQRSMPWTAVALAALLAAMLPAQAQQPGSDTAEPASDWTSTYPGPARDLRDPAADAPKDGADRSLIFPEVWCDHIEGDEETARICWEAYRAGLGYYEWGLDHRKRVLWWQHMTTRAIFFIVLSLVGIGIYFAWVQFRATPMSGTSHELEVSTSGVKVSSPVLGVIILTLSLVFFYLYLSYVYPVQEVI